MLAVGLESINKKSLRIRGLQTNGEELFSTEVEVGCGRDRVKSTQELCSFKFSVKSVSQ